MEILALIPARSGSKGIPHKNIAMFDGKPLLAHSIEQARRAKKITRVILSTDSELYAGIGRQYGAEVPFLRPAEIAGDLATDLQVFEHALGWLTRAEGYRPEVCVHLRPTYPTRRSDDIDQAVELLLSDPSFDSVRTVAPAPHTPFKMWFMGYDGALTPVLDCGLPEAYNLPRQQLPEVYLQQANVDVVWTRVVLEHHSMTGHRIRGMVLEEVLDVDTAVDLSMARRSSGLMRGLRLVFDIDGVIATLTPDNDYLQAEPIQPVVNLINQLYEDGNTIILHTARGSMTGKNWETMTREQLSRWGVRYHSIQFGKPAGDYYIDDRNLSVSELSARVAQNRRAEA